MPLSIRPKRVTSSEIEAFIDASTPLVVGQLLRLEGDAPVYTEVTSLQTLSSVDHLTTNAECLASMTVLFGEPGMGFSQATLLNATELGGELQTLLGHVRSPLFLGGSFMGDLKRLGTLSVVSGDSLEAKHQALVEIMDGLQVDQRLLVMDPLGLFAFAEGYHVMTAGQEVQLSLQGIGVATFLSKVGEALPEAFQDEGLALLSRALPLTLDFIPFKYFLNTQLYDECPAKGALIHVLHTMHAQQVFATSPEKVFAMDATVSDQMNVLDLSGIENPWRGVFYDYVCHELIRHKEHGLIPVLVYPENYLDNLPHYIQKWDEAEYNVLVLSSRQSEATYTDAVAHYFEAEYELGGDEVHVHLCGEMTLGLPMKATLKGLDGDELDEIEQLEAESASLIDGDTDEAEECFTPFPETTTANTEQKAETLVLEASNLTLQSAESLLTEASTDSLPEEVEAEAKADIEEDDDLDFDFDTRLDEPLPDRHPDIAPPLEPTDDTPPVLDADQEAALDELFPSSLDDQTSTVSDMDDEFDFDFDSEVTSSTAIGSDDTHVDASVATTPKLQNRASEPIPILSTMDPESQDLIEKAGYQAGDRVSHEKYGEGVVAKVIPGEDRVTLNITFDDVGKRLMDASSSALTTLDHSSVS